MKSGTKKLLVVLLAVAVLIGAAAVAAIAADQTFSSDGITYKVLDEVEKTVSVSGCDSDQSSITIPETVTYDGIAYTVTEIARGAMKGHASLESVTIPASVTSSPTPTPNPPTNTRPRAFSKKNSSRS